MPQPPDFRYDVFLSHNHADKARVRRLAERLKAEVPIHPSSLIPHPFHAGRRFIPLLLSDCALPEQGSRGARWKYDFLDGIASGSRISSVILSH